MGSPQLVGGDFVCQVGAPEQVRDSGLANWGSACVSRQKPTMGVSRLLITPHLSRIAYHLIYNFS